MYMGAEWTYRELISYLRKVVQEVESDVENMLESKERDKCIESIVLSTLSIPTRIVLELYFKYLFIPISLFIAIPLLSNHLGILYTYLLATLICLGLITGILIRAVLEKCWKLGITMGFMVMSLVKKLSEEK